MGLLEQIRSGTFVPDDGPALVSPGRRHTLREAGGRVVGGEDLLIVIREFLDQAGRAETADLAGMIDEAPVALKRRGILWPARSLQRV